MGSRRRDQADGAGVARDPARGAQGLGLRCADGLAARRRADRGGRAALGKPACGDRGGRHAAIRQWPDSDRPGGRRRGGRREQPCSDRTVRSQSRMGRRARNGDLAVPTRFRQYADDLDRPCRGAVGDRRRLDAWLARRQRGDLAQDAGREDAAAQPNPGAGAIRSGQAPHRYSVCRSRRHGRECRDVRLCRPRHVRPAPRDRHGRPRHV